MARETRTPIVPDLLDTSPAGIRQWARQVQQSLGLVTGDTSRTSEALLDKAVTFRDLIEQGFALEAPAGSGAIVLPGTDEGSFSTIPPPAPLGFNVARLPYNTRLTWTAPTYPNHLLTEIWRNSVDNLTTAEMVGAAGTGVSIWEDGYLTGNTWFYWIRFRSTALIAGAFNAISGTSGSSQPGDVGGFTYTLEGMNVRLRWTAVANPDLSHYELRVGATWETATLIDEVRGTSYLWVIQTIGSYTIWLRARDISGFYSGSASSINVIVSAPGTTSLGFVLSGETVMLSWAAVAGSFNIDYYEVRYGDTWAGATLLNRGLATAWIQRVGWAGVRRFWVAARDVAGNYATPMSVDVTIIVPGAVGNFHSEVVDNNVLLFWNAPATGSLPIATYELRKGAVFSSATVIGEKSGLFTSVFEQASGNYTYWLRAKDSAGNYGSETPVTVWVSQPPDYVLYDDLNVNLSGVTLSSAVYDGSGVTLPFNTTETYDQHYTTRSWTNDDAAIAAGFPVYAQPAPTTGYLEATIDYGVSIPATSVNVTPTLQVIAGTPTNAIQISWKLLVGDPWTDLPAGASGFISSSFRYLRVRLTATTSGAGVGLYRCTVLNVKLAVKMITDSGQAYGNAGDTGGTIVLLNLAFLDLFGPPMIQPVGTSAIIATVDFVDAPNPTEFKVLLWNLAGARVSAAFSWTARGV